MEDRNDDNQYCSISEIPNLYLVHCKKNQMYYSSRRSHTGDYKVLVLRLLDISQEESLKLINHGKIMYIT